MSYPRQQALLEAIRGCLGEWEHDRAYADVAQHLRQVEQELDVLTASPGRRAAFRSAMPNPSGQEPRDRQEPPMEAHRDTGYTPGP